MNSTIYIKTLHASARRSIINVLLTGKRRRHCSTSFGLTWSHRSLHMHHFHPHRHQSGNVVEMGEKLKIQYLAKEKPRYSSTEWPSLTNSSGRCCCYCIVLAVAGESIIKASNTPSTTLLLLLLATKHITNTSTASPRWSAQMDSHSFSQSSKVLWKGRP